MIVERELYLSVLNPGSSYLQTYRLNQDVTILTNDNYVLQGIIVDIKEKSVVIECGEDKNQITIDYDYIAKIADTDWLCGDDIREP